MWTTEAIKGDLEVLDAKIARLKIEYEQYFIRILRREPLDLRDEIDKLVIRYSTRPIVNASMKFKYTSLVARYNTYRQYWNRTLREIEEGRFARKAEADEGAVTEMTKAEEAEAKREVAEAARAQRPLTVYENAFQQFQAAKKKCHDPSKDINFDTFMGAVNRQKETIKKTAGSDAKLKLKIYIRNGKAKIALKPDEVDEA